jgi:hypothetical protein
MEMNRLIGEINGKPGTPEWTPLGYINRSIERCELVGLVQAGGCLPDRILSRRDQPGRKEYVACKSEGDWVLVLSEFAGPTAEMFPNYPHKRLSFWAAEGIIGRNSEVASLEEGLISQFSRRCA